MKNKTSNRRLIFQLAAVVVLIVIAYAMTIIGRGHTVYLDNKKLEYNGKSYDTPYKVVVFVDGEQVAKLYDRERGSATCIGQKFTVTLEITEKKGGSETTQTYTIPLPKNMDGIIINLPAYLAGLGEDALSDGVHPVARRGDRRGGHPLRRRLRHGRYDDGRGTRRLTEQAPHSPCLPHGLCAHQKGGRQHGCIERAEA